MTPARWAAVFLVAVVLVGVIAAADQLAGILLFAVWAVWCVRDTARGGGPDPAEQACALTRPAPDIRPWLPLDDDPRDDGGVCVEPPFVAQSWPALPPAPPQVVEHGIARLENFLKEHA